MTGNASLAAAMGIAHARPLDGLVAATQLFLAVVATGYVIQTIGTLRTEEADGRLETRLCGTLSRTHWLASHALVILGGLLTIVVCSSLILGLATALSVGDMAELGPTLTSGLAYLPAELVLAGLALAVYGLRPEMFGIAWAGYAVMTFIALLGPGLKLPQWLLDFSPTTHVHNPPADTIRAPSIIVMAAVAVILVAIGFVAFRRRGVPQN